MAEIIKVYKQSVGATRFIGKKYGNADRVDGDFGAKWGEWHENDWFNMLKQSFDGNISEAIEDYGSHIGLMREDESGQFEYWIGLFMPAGAAVPEGFASIDFPAGNLGVCWIYGKEEEVFMLEGKCGERLEKEGFAFSSDWCFERYNCPRFTTPDEKGNIIIDICFYVK